MQPSKARPPGAGLSRTIRILCLGWLFLFLAAVGHARQADEPRKEARGNPKRDEALRKELLQMVKEDQDARMKILKAPSPDAATLRAIADIDRKNTARLKEIVDKHGWPGKSLVGDDGAHAAWLLVQHADRDRAFQKKCLTLLERAVKAQEASPTDFAYLTDRVLVGENKKQIYGTQFRMVDGKWEPFPIADEKNVDRRRKEAGMPGLAEYRKVIEEMHKPQAEKKESQPPAPAKEQLEKPRKHSTTKESKELEPRPSPEEGSERTWPSVMMCW